MPRPDRRDPWSAIVRLLCLALLLAAPGAPRTAAAEPDGRLIVEAMEYPWSAIGRVNAGGRGHCTGFLVGPRHALTAAHCLYNAVEGRWWGANELHFVAGYQRDQYLIHSPVRGYQRSPAFDTGAGSTAANAVADWAVLTLEEPIGRQAGWLGLRVPGAALLAELDAGRTRLFQAGYRSGQAHAMTANTACRLVGVFAAGRGLAHDCPVFHGDSGSPLLVFLDRRPVVVGILVQRAETDGGVVAWAVSMAVLDAEAALRSVESADGGPWGPGRAPPAGGPAGALPLATIDRLLARLGHLGTAKARAAAIRRFEAAEGLPVTGAASLALLGALLSAHDTIGHGE